MKRVWFAAKAARFARWQPVDAALFMLQKY
jgi:hypothetical protein